MTSIFDRPVFARARRLCLAFPETVERSSWGHPNFRAGKKTFCTFEIIKGRPSIAFKLPPADVKRMLQKKHFYVTPYGRGVWVSLRVDGDVNWTIVGRLVEESYRGVAIKRMLAALDARRGSD